MPKNPLSLSPRLELLKLERRIFDENRQTIKDATIVEDRGFKDYNRQYQKAVARYQKLATMDEVLADVSAARVVLVGDYHTLDQAQRSFVRLLRAVFKSLKNVKITVALEAVQARFQRHLDAYLVGSLKSRDFIRKIGFKKHWFFDLWAGYEIIFDFLAYHHIPIQAIDADNRKIMTLVERDDFMATEIIKLVKNFPEEKIIVLVGDLHLAPRHLPHKIKKLARKEKIDVPMVRLYQNSPEIYWQLSKKQHVDHTLLVKIREHEYCRMHTPPIIVQQSYLNWLYHEEGAFDWIDAKMSFIKLVERIASLLKVELPRDHEEIEVYSCGDLSFLKTLRGKRLFSRKNLAMIKRRVLESKSYFLPEVRLVYIANVSINHAAQEASRYLRYLKAGQAGHRPHRDAFYLKVIEDAVAFFGSKLVNHKRKCARVRDYRSEIQFLQTSGQARCRHVEFEVAKLFVQHALQIKKGDVFHTNRIMNLSDDVFSALTKAIGYDLGDLLYYGFMSGRIDKTGLSGLYVNPFSEENEPWQVYLGLTRKLKGLKRPMQI